MLFNSYEFIFLFLPLTVIGYFGLLHLGLRTSARGWLLLSSLFFYSYWKLEYLPLILGSVVFNYSVGAALGGGWLVTRLGAGRLLALGVTANLSVLAWFKYADFLIENLNRSIGADLPALHIELPLAISFFTFQQIAYLVDSRRGLTTEYDPLRYSVFVTFFPQLIAGPIVHHSEVIPQFSSEHKLRLSYRSICLGITVFAIGLFKKTVIADNLAVYANVGFDEAGSLHLIAAWAASLSYTLQIYFDFSGYADMAIGAALLFNIDIPINFNSPFKALDIQDHWRRWHITLSRFLRDYVYIPLGGNRVIEIRINRNLLLTFLIGGLWHGAGWTFIFWGFLHGSAQIAHRQWRRLGLSMARLPAWLLTFAFVNFCFVFFRALDWSDAIRVVRGMSGIDGVLLPESLEPTLGFLGSYGVQFGDVYAALRADGDLGISIIAALSIATLAPNSMQLKDRFRPNLFWLVFVMITLYWGVSGLTNVNEFLYFNF
jgi:D-alanyl-lipoteichoic acid acyltransferase DltB (MBOAT superfamily)